MTETAVFTADEVLELVDTQQVRKQLIRKLTADGEVPAKGQVLLLGLLDGADRSTLSRAKMRQTAKRDADAANIARMVGETLKAIDTRTYRPAATPIQREVPPELAHRTYVDGEMDVVPEARHIGK